MDEGLSYTDGTVVTSEPDTFPYIDGYPGGDLRVDDSHFAKGEWKSTKKVLYDN